MDNDIVDPDFSSFNINNQPREYRNITIIRNRLLFVTYKEGELFLGGNNTEPGINQTAKRLPIYSCPSYMEYSNEMLEVHPWCGYQYLSLHGCRADTRPQCH